MNHHIKYRNNVVLSAGPKKLHVVETCEHGVSLKLFHGLISLDVSILHFIVLELVYHTEIDDGHLELRGIKQLRMVTVYHYILGLDVVVGPSRLMH